MVFDKSFGTVEDSFPEVWKAIENKEILQSKINEYFLNVLLDIIKDVKEGKRDEMDIGDIFGLAIQHASASKGYKFNPKVEDFFFELGTYKSDPFESGEYDPNETLENVEKRTRKILLELDKN